MMILIISNQPVMKFKIFLVENLQTANRERGYTIVDNIVDKAKDNMYRVEVASAISIEAADVPIVANHPNLWT